MGGENTSMASSFQFQSFIRGFHVYQDYWTPYLNEELSCVCEEDNVHDKFEVAVTKQGHVIGHVPKEFSKNSTILSNGEEKLQQQCLEKGKTMELDLKYLLCIVS